MELNTDDGKVRSRQAEAVRAAWAAKSDAERQRLGAVMAERRTAAYAIEHAERELAKRAGEACPVCGREIGANGMCCRSAGCFDDGMSRVIQGWNPRGLIT